MKRGLFGLFIIATQKSRRGREKKGLRSLINFFPPRSSVTRCGLIKKKDRKDFLFCSSVNFCSLALRGKSHFRGRAQAKKRIAERANLVSPPFISASAVSGFLDLVQAEFGKTAHLHIMPEKREKAITCVCVKRKMLQNFFQPEIFEDSERV